MRRTVPGDRPVKAAAVVPQEISPRRHKEGRRQVSRPRSILRIRIGTERMLTPALSVQHIRQEHPNGIQTAGIEHPADKSQCPYSRHDRTDSRRLRHSRIFPHRGKINAQVCSGAVPAQADTVLPACRRFLACPVHCHGQVAENVKNADLRNQRIFRTKHGKAMQTHSAQNRRLTCFFPSRNPPP